jgi:hypothetical protein
MNTSARPQATHAKVCVRCGREIEWRKKWERVWGQVKYCSDACRRQRLTKVDQALEDEILRLLKLRSRDATICPSEAARAHAAPDDPGWPKLCERARQAARRLVSCGQVEITQRGKVGNPSRTKGPIRIRLVRR